MSKRVLIEDAKVIGRLEHYPRDFIVQNLKAPEQLYRIPVDKCNKLIGETGSIMYVSTSNEGYYTFD